MPTLSRASCRVARGPRSLVATGPPSPHPAGYRVSMQPGNTLGEYLRPRRELVAPESAGVPHIGRRRVPGLRRDEVSLLAGVSTDYYVRLEQGRDRNPSPQVLASLARALQLDDEATAHLHALAGPERYVRRSGGHPELVAPSIQQLIIGWHDTPAYV